MSEPVPDWLKKSSKEPHSERIVNKAYELERERQGEVLPCTVKGSCKGLLVHIPGRCDRSRWPALAWRGLRRREMRDYR